MGREVLQGAMRLSFPLGRIGPVPGSALGVPCHRQPCHGRAGAAAGVPPTPGNSWTHRCSRIARKACGEIRGCFTNHKPTAIPAVNWQVVNNGVRFQAHCPQSDKAVRWIAV